MLLKEKQETVFGIAKCNNCKSEYSFLFSEIDSKTNTTKCKKCKKLNNNFLVFDIEKNKSKFKTIKININ